MANRDTPELLARIEELFHRALEVEESDRARFLDAECSGDGELRERVARLLDLDQNDEGLPNAAPLRPLTEIGPYRIVERIGRGGMGVVWRAERADGQFQQSVAIKTVQSSIATRTLLERFRAERQVLANLTHPNIARLLDGGETDEGAPYFVMEYVEGQAIDEYCDRNELSIEARLELFRKVCDAVQYAHRNLIVHRDLKPSNILVGSDGEPKLLDFGIAKMLPGHTGESVHTGTGQRAMTARYASPEQISGDTITTGTDVYALGVVLYELLTHRSPYRTTTDSVAEVERAVLETDPDRPSTVLRQLAASGEGEALQRARADRSWKRLEGDLDTILLMALRKDASRRYASVEQFSEDVRRHLVGLPVIARPDTWAYRTKKLLLRRRVPIAAAAIVTITVLAALVVSYSSYREAEDARQDEASAKEEAILGREAADLARRDAERERAKAEDAEEAAVLARDEAQREAAIATAVSHFLETILTAADPLRSEVDLPIVRDVSVVEVLDHAAEVLDEETFEFPDVEARVLRTLGRSYYNRGEFDKAWEMQNRARERLSAIAGTDDVRMLAIQKNRADTLVGLGHYAEAKAILEETLAIESDRRGPEHPELLETRQRIAIVRLKEFDLEGAERELREILDVRERTRGESDPGALECAYTLTTVLMSQGRVEDAEELALETLELRREALGEEHPRTIDSIDQLGAVYRRMRGRIRDSEKYYREAYEKRRTVLGPEHPRTFISQSGMAQALMWCGRAAEALDEFEQFVPVQRRILGDAHHTVLSNRIEMTNALGALRRFDEMEPILRDVVEIAYRDLEEDDHFRPHARATFALFLSHTGRVEEAEKNFLQAYEELVQKFRPEHRRVHNLVRGIVAFYKRTGNDAELEVWQARLGGGAPR